MGLIEICSTLRMPNRRLVQVVSKLTKMCYSDIPNPSPEQAIQEHEELLTRLSLAHTDPAHYALCALDDNPVVRDYLENMEYKKGLYTICLHQN